MSSHSGCLATPSSLSPRSATRSRTAGSLGASGGAARQDTIRWPRQLWAKIASLAGYSSGSDDRPTDQMIEVRDQYREQIAEQLRRWIELAETDIAQFNRLLAAQGLPPIISQQ